MRRAPSQSIEKEVLMRSLRRCCLCFFLKNIDAVCRGQIAHLNRDPSDSRFDNLAFLCLDHHDEYDTRPSQSRALAPAEVKEYRDRLYKAKGASASPAQIEAIDNSEAIAPLPPTSQYEALRARFPRDLAFLDRSWHYPLWQVEDRPELFAYSARNNADGICLIERIDLPDGRVVIACIEMAGNPGIGITNNVEDLCFQVCDTFDIPAERLVWLEHYDYYNDGEWERVVFKRCPPNFLFEYPEWIPMSTDMWAELGLKPKQTLRRVRGNYESKIEKLFPRA